MALKYGWFGQELIRACIDLNDLQLHRRYSNRHYFYLDIPGLDGPAVGMLMGQGNLEVGLNIFFGPDALKHFHQVNDGASFSRIKRSAHMMGYSFADVGEWSPPSKKWLKSTQYKYARGQQLPEPLTVSPSKGVNCPDDRETRQLLFAVRGILKAYQDGTFNPKDTPPEKGVLTLMIDGEADAPNVTTEIRFPDGRSEAPTVSSSAMSGNPFLFLGCPRIPEHWLVTMRKIKLGLPGEEDFPPSLFILEEHSGPLYFESLDSDDPREALDVLEDLMRGKIAKSRLPEGYEAGIPERMTFGEPALHDAACGGLASLGIEVQCDPGNTLLDEAIDRLVEKVKSLRPEDIPEEFLEDLERVTGDFTLPINLKEAVGAGVPAGDHLDHWLDVEIGLNDWLWEIVNEQTFESTRAMKRYFGCEDGGYLLDEFEGFQADRAYLGWLAFSYRPNKTSKTISEKRLPKKSSLHPAVRQLAQSLQVTPPSLYRVLSVDAREGTALLKDVLRGGEIKIWDAGLAEAMDGAFSVVLRVYPAGDFHFVFPAGPVFNQMMEPEVLRFLSDQNVSFNTKSMLSQSHVFGHLWDWLDKKLNRRPELRNTDGDPILMHTAAFKMTNRAALDEAFGRNPQITPMEQAGEYIWETPSSNPAGGLIFAHLRTMDDELILECNSVQRYRTARTYLESIGALRFEGVKTFSPSDEELPLDDRLGEPSFLSEEDIPDEVKRQAYDFLENHYRGWLDSPLPALDGKTPRQATGDKHLRPRLESLLETLRCPMGAFSVDFEPIRRMLYRELGLS